MEISIPNSLELVPIQGQKHYTNNERRIYDYAKGYVVLN
mgnify:CR=1 FL=1|jgi:hypothetical protein